MRHDEIPGWFSRYTTPYLENDDTGWMRRKQQHTLAVAANAQALAGMLGWEEEEQAVARTAAFLHDIGRFPQLRHHQTFRDDLSEDHAEAGLRIIEGERLLKGIPREEQDVIKEAVRLHNKPDTQVPCAEDRRTRHAWLLKDADKIDIIKVVQDTAQEQSERFAALNGVEEQGSLSEEVRRLLLAGSHIRKQEVKTTMDNKAFLLNWVHHLHYPQSLLLLEEQGRFEEMLREISDGHVREALRSAYEKRLSEAS